MKLTKSQLKQIIKEELEKALNENEEVEEAIKLGFVDPYDDGLRKYAGMMAYKRWVAEGRPQRN